MGTTVDLPPIVYKRARALAEARGESLSKTIADFATRGLAQIEGSVTIAVDPRSGFPVMSFGFPITDEDVASILDEE